MAIQRKGSLTSRNDARKICLCETLWTCKMSNKRVGISNISGCSLKVSGAPPGFPVLGQDWGVGGTSLGKRPASSSPFSSLSPKCWRPTHAVSCVSLAVCFWPPQLQERPAQVLFEILPSWRGPWGALRQSEDLPFAPAWIWGAFPGQLCLICQRASKGCCTGQTHSWEKRVAYIKVSSILNDSVIFLTGCFSCNMLYISLLTHLVRNHSAFFWCAQWACRSAGIWGELSESQTRGSDGKSSWFSFPQWNEWCPGSHAEVLPTV